MENSHKYFKRDISWLSFNYRVLLEAEDETLPIYERIKFLSIYSSNLEEFYEIRVAEHRGVIMKKNFTEESGAEAEETLAEITEEVNRQQREYYRIFSKVLQELNRQDIYLYQDSRPEPFHEEFVHNFFNEEVFAGHDTSGGYPYVHTRPSSLSGDPDGEKEQADGGAGLCAGLLLCPDENPVCESTSFYRIAYA